MRIVDANIILRYLLDDDPQLAAKATAILEQGTVHAPFEVLAEVVYVMQGVYAVPRTEISSTLRQFIELANITTDNTPVLAEALQIYAERGLDFVDAILCAYHRIDGHEIETFDKKLKKSLVNSFDLLWVREAESRYAEIETDDVICRPIDEAVRDARGKLK